MVPFVSQWGTAYAHWYDIVIRLLLINIFTYAQPFPNIHRTENWTDTHITLKLLFSKGAAEQTRMHIRTMSLCAYVRE